MTRSTLFVLSILLHLYIGIRVVPELVVLGMWAPWLMAAVLASSSFLMPLGLLAQRVASGRLALGLTWAGLVFMGLFSSLLVWTLLRDVALLVMELVYLMAPDALSKPLVRPHWREVSAQAIPLLGLVSSVVGFCNARRTAAVFRVDIPIRDLPPAWQGFTFAQISDLHVGPTIRKPYLRRIVDRVNSLQADVVAITGDLVDGRVGELGPQLAPLADLKSRHGTYVVTGNHEYYSGAHAWIDELRRLGLVVLMNQHVVIPCGPGPCAEGRPLVLAGVTDYNAAQFDLAHRSDPQAALAGSPLSAAVRVLLAHQPRTAPAAARAGFDLQLSGHTHGGQFFPWIFFVRFQQPFTAGLHKLQNLWVYTSRGTGYWGPPKRFGAPSEITLLRLVAQ